MPLLSAFLLMVLAWLTLGPSRDTFLRTVGGPNYTVSTQKFVLLVVIAARTTNPTNLLSYDTVSSTDPIVIASLYHRVPQYVHIHRFLSLSSLAFR
jgi:hypothetical protein